MSAQSEVEAEPEDCWDRFGEGVKAAVIEFRNFLKDREKDFQYVISLHPVELCSVLGEFYLSLKDKQTADVSHMTTVRAGLHVYFLTIRNIDIIVNPDFMDCNAVAQWQNPDSQISPNLPKKITPNLPKSSGPGVRRHSRQRTFTFDTNELRQIYMSEAMCLDKPESLQNKVFFDVCMYICNRGKDFLRVMTKTDYEVSTDQNGRRYAWLKYDPKFSFREVAGGMPCDGNPGSQIGERMYERPGDPKCPVASFTKYLTHLHPMSDAFWQRPKRSIQQGDFVWFDNNAIGNSTLNKLMNRITQQSGLQDNYAINAIKSSYIPIIETICRSALLGSQQFRRILQLKESQGHQYMNVRKRHSEGSLGIRSVLAERPLVRGRKSEGHIYYDHMSDTDTGISRCNSASPVLKPPVNWEIGAQSPGLCQVSEGMPAGYQAYRDMYRDSTARFRDSEAQHAFADLQRRRNSDQQGYSETGQKAYIDSDTGQNNINDNGIHAAKQKCLEIVHGLDSRDIKAFISWMKTFQAEKGEAGLVVTCQPVHMGDQGDTMDHQSQMPPPAVVPADDYQPPRPSGHPSPSQPPPGPPQLEGFPRSTLQQLNGACFQKSHKGVQMCDFDVTNVEFENNGTAFCSRPNSSPLKICIPTQETVLMTGVQPDYQILIHTRKPGQCDRDPLESRIYSSSERCDIRQINSVILRQLENMSISSQTRGFFLGVEADNKSNCFTKLKEEKSVPMKKRTVVEQLDKHMDQGTMLQTVMEQNSQHDHRAVLSQQHTSPSANPMSQHFSKRFPDACDYSPFEKRQRFGETGVPREDAPLNLVKQL